MRNLKNNIIKFAIAKAKKSKLIQSLFEAPINVETFDKFGEFTDKYGNKFELLKGLREKIRPGWESMVSEEHKFFDDKIIKTSITNGKIAVNKIMPIIKTFDLEIDNKVILEIGCHSGAVSFALAEQGAKEVVGTEFSGYKINSVGEGKIEEVNIELKKGRDKISEYFKKSSKVSFIDDDICNSKLKSNYFDIVCSWDVLEHIKNPELAFKNIASVLKEGGIAISEYNPFFSLNGGHSLCTLDFLWGHTRIDDNDFLKYVEEFRPREKNKAFPFFKDGLNRMTIADLVKFSNNAGLEILSLLMFTKEQHVRMVNKDILTQSKNIYPNLQLADLVNPRIIVIHKK